jgi:catechol 2,3-dioxygenase-like lactoylglutathione lyase family enzyme
MSKPPTSASPSPAPDGHLEIRAFVPARDFATSAAFYDRLGFRRVVDSHEVVVFELKGMAFILQNYFDEGWARNCMMQLMVEDLDAWWAHIESLDLPAAFGVGAPKPPKVQPWGLRVGFLTDPSGVLWHVAQHPMMG